MRYRFIYIVIVIFSLVLPNTVGAIECSSNGYTIATINGILTDRRKAEENLNELVNKIRSDIYKNQPIDFHYLYNPTHLAGANDFIDVIQQGLFDQKSDYDLVEMLNDASKKVKTQKLLLVAHSQGNFYANNFYDKVASQVGGVPSKSIGVYGVGSPASWVAGAGKYLTSDTDSVIAATAAKYFSILKPNVHIELKPKDGNGHGFADVYLKYQGNKIVSDIKSSLSKLKENDEQSKNELCISPPKLTALHKIQGVVLAVADPAAVGIRTGLAASYKAGAYVRDKVGNAGLAIGNVINKVAVSIGKLAKNLSANVAESLPDDAPNLTTILSGTPPEASAEENSAPQEIKNESENPEVSALKVSTEDTTSSEPSEEIIIVNESENNSAETEKPKKRRSGGGGSADNSESAPPADSTPETTEPESAPEAEPETDSESDAEEEPEPEPDPTPITSNILYSQPDSSVEINNSPHVPPFDIFTGKSGHIQGIKFAYNDAGNSAGKFIGVSVVDRTEGINYYGMEEGNSCGNTYESTGSNEKVIVELDSAIHYKAYPCTGPDLVLDPSHTYGVALFANNFVDNNIKFYGASSSVNDNTVYLEITDDSIPSPRKAVKTFKFPSLGAAGVIDEESHQIAISVPFGTDITALAPVIRISGGAAISPASEEEQDFTNPVNYTVTAENGTTETYEAAVTARTNVVYSQPDNSVEIIGTGNINLQNLFNGAAGKITNLKFSYNDYGSGPDHFIGVQIIDQNTSKGYYAFRVGLSDVCGDAYSSNSVNAPVIAELGSDYEYREYPCNGPNLILDPTHSYGVSIFRNRGGLPFNTQRFYGSSSAIEDAYLYIESDGIIPSPKPDPLPDASPEITSYTFDGTEEDITVDPIVNPVTLSFNASENVDWVSIIIENESDAGVDKQFRSGSDCEDDTSTCEKTWDGTLSGGGIAPAGVYRVKVHIKDADGNVFQEFLDNTITVDFSITEEELIETAETSDQVDLAEENEEETAGSEEETDANEGKDMEDVGQENIGTEEENAEGEEEEEAPVDDHQSNEVPDAPVGQ